MNLVQMKAMMTMSVGLWVGILVALFGSTDAYPSKLCSSSGCNQALAVGNSYMGSSAILSGDNSVTVKRSGVKLNDGDSYVGGETLAISITTTSNYQYLLQATGGATISSASCSGTRITSSGSMVMPSSGTITMNAVRTCSYY